MIRFISLAPYLRNEEGHFFVYHQLIRDAVVRLGFIHKAYCSLQLELVDLGPDWIPHFWSERKGGWIRAFQYLKAYWRKNKEPRIFIHDCFDVSEFFLITWATFFGAKKRDSLWLVYRYDLTQVASKRRVFLFLFKLLKMRLKGRVSLCTDTDRLMNESLKDLKGEVELLPIPHVIEGEPLSQEKKERLILLHPGPHKPTKGLAELQRLSHISDPLARHFIFRIEENAPISIPKNEMKLEFIKHPLPREDYQRNLQEADIILLPYCPFYYTMNSSGILIEATILGKMTFVREGSCVAIELKKYGLDALILDWSSEDLFTQIHRVYHDPKVRQKLKEMQEDYKRFHSIENFERKIKKIAEKMIAGAPKLKLQLSD